MPRSLQELEQDIRSLDAREKNRLLSNLIADLDGDADPGIEESWLNEAKRRYEELRDGKVSPVSLSAVIENAVRAIGAIERKTN